MQLVVELREACRHGRADFRGLVTLQTNTLCGQQIVIQARAGERRRMANGTIQLRAQVQPVRKWLRRLRHSRAGDHNQQE
jgi:hypothetical protein